MKKLLSLIVFFVGSACCLFAQTSDTITVSGTVYVGAPGLPLPGYDIDYLVSGASFFYTGQVQTDQNGDYAFDVIYPLTPVTMLPDITLTYADCFGNPLPTQILIAQVNSDTIQDIIVCQNTLCSASFSYYADPITPLEVNFASNYGGQNSYSWDMGDGTTLTGSNIQYTYATSDTFQVCLVVMDSVTGCTDTSCQDVYVSSSPPLACDASFSVLPNAGPLNCFFPTGVSQNPNLTYFWDFGDGTTSTDQVACHGYMTNDTFDICLIVLDTVQGCTDTSCIQFVNGNVGAFCHAGFTYLAGPNDTVSFTNTSVGLGSLTYQWDFGDGSSSSLPDPVHVFGGDSAYLVCLTISDTSGCSNTYCEWITFGCDATFLCDPDPFNPLTINFLSTTNSIATFTWDFGDGNTATGPAVTHTYAVADTYVVCLMVDDGFGCTDTTCMTAIVSNNNPFPCNASFQTTYSPGGGICFAPLQPFIASTMFWDFGDGNTSTDPYPCHVYSNLQPGDSVTVCLTISDPSGCVDSSCLTIVVPGTGCSAAFTAISDTSGYQWTLVASDTTADVYNWDFGGGTVLTFANPWAAVVQYNSPGIIPVCLQVSDSSGCSDFYCEPLFVGVGAPCGANFSHTPIGNDSVLFTIAPNLPNALYVWDFGDGTTDSTNNLTTIHTYASAGSYQVCLTVFNTNGCVDVSCQVVTTYPNNPPNTLSILGQVTAGNGLADDFTAYLIEYDSVAGTLTAVDTFVSSVAATGLTGLFYFNVQAGSYLVKVALNSTSAIYSNYLPTYFGDELFWNNATYIDPSSFPFLSIDMVAGANPGGPGFVGGLVSQGANKQGEPMGGMHVLVTHMDDSPLTYTLTHEDGTFELEDLPYGTYKVWVEMWGRDLNYHIVTLSPAEPAANNLDFEITDEEVVAGTALGLEQFLENGSSWKIYPNPASNLANVVLNFQQGIEMSLSMSNVLGQEVYKQSYQAFVGQNTYQIPVQELESGVYMIHVEIQGSTFPLSKLMIE